MKRSLGWLLIAILMLSPFSTAAVAEDFSGTTIRIVQGTGLTYAPVYVMREKGLLEQRLPGVKIEWSTLPGGTTMNEALISDQVDVAFMGVPPLLTAWDKGVSFRVSTCIGVPVFSLQVSDPAIQSVKDIKPDDKIAVPGVTSLQAILLSMAAKAELGDPHALDHNILGMANPDAYAALISGTDIVGHFTALPFIAHEQAEGMHTILTQADVFPKLSSIVCVTTEKFHANAEVHEALVAALNDALDLINAKTDDIYQIVAQTEQITPEQAREYLEWEGSLFDNKLHGAMEMAAFMKEVGFMDNELKDVNDILWPGAPVAE